MDLEYPEIMRRLSVPAAAPPPAGTGGGVTRRRFLQLGAMGAGGLAAAPFLSQLQAFAAPALGPTDGILVVILMGGGNDGLDTLGPVNDARYAQLRPSLRITPAAGLAVGEGLALHPSLTKLKARFDSGNVAIVRGVGYQPPDLSHFTSMALWMQGWGGSGGVPNGWLGRYLDGLPNAATESLYAATIGTSVPLHLVGSTTRASGLPENLGDAFAPDPDNPSSVRQFAAYREMAADPTGLGAWGDTLARATTNAMDLSERIRPVYANGLPDDGLGRDLGLCARLINMNLGLRVLNTAYGDFDHHAEERGKHTTRMQQLDDAVDAFYAVLDPAYRSRVTIMTFSEFGRRPEENDSGGTDHGTASVQFVIGDRVKGGLYGAQPSLTDLDNNDNLKVQVDFRSVYGTILDSWLKADSTQILGKSYPNLGFFSGGPGSPNVIPARTRRKPHVRRPAPARP